jgi:hypothetical protein
MSLQSRITPDRAVLTGVLLTAAVYCRDLKYDFLLDDVSLILINQTTASWRNLKMIFTTDVFFAHGPSVPMVMVAVHYRPVFMLWLMMNQQLFGSILPWWHITSLLLHICVIYLVYKLGLNVLKERWAAALAALLFAFHPIHVESVSYVSASTDLLVTLFLLIAFLFYSQFREEQDASPAYLVIAVFSAALAMLSKETGAMLPWILIAYEALREMPPGTARRWKQFVWTLPFFTVVGIYGIVRTMLFGREVGSVPGTVRIGALADVPLVLLTYLRNLVWSFRLSFFYPSEWSSKWTFWKGSMVVLVVVIAALLWKHYRNRPAVRLQLLWTLILFVPPLLAVSTFVKEDWVHDRHMYAVTVPFLLVIAALLTDPRLTRKFSVVVSSLVLLVLLLETAVQVPRFSDGVSIFETALKVAPDNALAHRYLAFALCNYGRYDESFREYRITTQLQPKEPTAYGSYAEALSEVGRDEDAAAEYTKALHWAPRPTPYRAFLLYRLASINIKYSKSAEGEAYLREAIHIAPQTPSYHSILAEALRQQGRLQEADQEMLLEASVQKSFTHANPMPAR